MDFNKMDKETLSQMMHQQIQQLQNEGLVDENFAECYSLKEYTRPTFFLDVLSVFLIDVKAAVRNMTRVMDQPVVDYEAMFLQGMKVKGSSLCMGVCPITNASVILLNAIKSNSKEGCLQALQILDNEHSNLYNRMAIVMKIEQEIISRG